jgi:hypothetical protein
MRRCANRQFHRRCHFVRLEDQRLFNLQHAYRRGWRRNVVVCSWRDGAGELWLLSRSMRGSRVRPFVGGSFRAWFRPHWEPPWATYEWFGQDRLWWWIAAGERVTTSLDWQPREHR